MRFHPPGCKYSLITCGWGEYIAHLFLVTLVDSTCFKSSRLWNGEVYPKYLTLGCMVNPIQPWMSCTSLACFRIEEHLPNCQVDYSYLQVLPVQCLDRFSKCATWGATALSSYFHAGKGDGDSYVPMQYEHLDSSGWILIFTRLFFPRFSKKQFSEFVSVNCQDLHTCSITNHLR